MANINKKIIGVPFLSVVASFLVACSLSIPVSSTTPVTKTHTVYFYDGNTVYFTETVSDGGVVNRPRDPSKENYVFEGWFDSSELIALFNFSALIHEDTSIYAGWKEVIPEPEPEPEPDPEPIPVPNTYTVNFYDGDTVYNTQSVSDGGVARRPRDPVRDDYVFEGWFDSREFVTLFNFATPIHEDTSIYAGWKKQEHEPEPEPEPEPYVEPAPESIEVKSPGRTEFYVGETFSVEGLVIEATYEGDVKRIISNERLTFSGIDMGRENVYHLSISFLGRTTGYDITVRKLDNLSINSTSFEDKTNTRGQDASEFKHIPTVSFQGDDLNLDSVNVQGDRVLPTGEPEPYSYSISDEWISIRNFDNRTLGKQNPVIHFEAGSTIAEKELSVNVTNVLPYINRGGNGRFVECHVDPSFTGVAGEMEQGNRSASYISKSYSHKFASISEAIDYLNMFTFEPDVVKKIYLADGTYNEKIDIKMPHTEIYGNTGDASKVIIQGSDAIGVTPNLTKASESYVVAVRETANDCHLNSLQIIHTASQDPTKDAAGTALIAQSDRFIAKNVSIAGLDQTIILGSDRYVFNTCVITGRSKMVDDAASGVIQFLSCTFRSLKSIKEGRDVMFDLPNNGSNNYSGAAKIGVRFDNDKFEAVDGTPNDSYAFFAVNSPYVSVEFHITQSVGAHLGTTKETLFLYGDYNQEMESIYIHSDKPLNGVELPGLPENLLNLFIKENGRGHFVDNWSVAQDVPYNTDKRVYIEFDGFHHTSEGDQAVIAHDLKLEASEQEVKVNDILKFAPIGGVHYDDKNHATVLGKGSKFTIKAPAGSIVYAQVITPVENVYQYNGLAVHVGNELHRIYRPIYTLHCNGSYGDMNEYVFEALEETSIKLVTIVPNAFDMTKWESGVYDYQPVPTNIFLRNSRFVFNHNDIRIRPIVYVAKDNLFFDYEGLGYVKQVDARDESIQNRIRCTVYQDVSGSDMAEIGDTYISGIALAKALDYADADSEYFNSNFYDGGERNSLMLFYVYGKEVPNYGKHVVYYDEHDDYEVLGVNEYEFYFNISEKWTEQYLKDMYCYVGYHSLSAAGLYDGELENISPLGTTDLYHGLVYLGDNGKAHYNTSNGGLTLEGTANLCARVGKYGRTNDNVEERYQMIFKVSKGTKLDITTKYTYDYQEYVSDYTLGDVILAKSTPEYDYLLCTFNDEGIVASDYRYKVFISAHEGGTATILGYEIFKM